MNYLEFDACGVGFVCDINNKESYQIVKWGIEAVKNLTHRGAIGGDGKTGDGAGILINIPKKFFGDYLKENSLEISDINNLAVGAVFLYKDVKNKIEKHINRSPFKLISWREVPIDTSAVGDSALQVMPKIFHLLLDTEKVEKNRVELELYFLRRQIEKDPDLAEKVYIASLSARTLVYKGMLVAPQLDKFYIELRDERIESSICLFHQRYSTNTFPDWTLAQPFRYLAHNGEINTLQGNRNLILALQNEFEHELFGEKIELVKPLVSLEESDSASLDRVFELLCLAGYSPAHVINMLIPPAWENVPDMPEEIRLFFEFQSFMMQPWDGPAAIAFTDGEVIGAHLDRNGLRPCRYILTEDGIMVLGSEVGMIDLSGKKIKEKGRLGPGDTIIVELFSGKVKKTDEILKELSASKPYKDWIKKYLVRLSKIVQNSTINHPQEDKERIRKQIAFGYTQEELENILSYMANEGKEVTFSTGDDTPIPPLSERPVLLFKYFKQRFAQVTNPPIDPIREKSIMSLRMSLGAKGNCLKETEEHARKLEIESPVLLPYEFSAIENQNKIKVSKVSITYPKNSFLEEAINQLCQKVEEEISKGVEIVILSDKDINKDKIAIPSLLAISAVFTHLLNKSLATKASLVLETGEARDTHQFCCLIGYGASAIYPYLAYETIYELCQKGLVKHSYEQAILNYKKALEAGILKIMSKMGISTLSSYYIGKIFETVCLNKDFVEKYFPGTPVTIEADGIKEVENSLLRRHKSAFESVEPKLDVGGEMRFKKGGEWHAWSPEVVRAFHKFLKTQDYKDYKEFSKIANNIRPAFIRHLLTYKKAENPISIEEVEPVEEILKRFVISAMSLGALSPEAHETLAEAANRLGMKSDSGEGGEDPARYWTVKNSAIKQVASGRFGVTPTYLASAKEIEIKIAQGAKPGEGGQLPGHKVNEYVAKLRHSQPGVTLISPPPHHDIYSIEDLAQLINDLKEANPQAKVCVKLVSEIGVGTIAAGVAKGYADVIKISGGEGGTGASPYSSIKHAGNYWEIGLAETQRILMENNLRDKVIIKADGAIRTGKDVIILALFGAEQYGFGTAALVALKCVMDRKCHTNRCPMGIATQDPEYRKRFKGKVEEVMAYFKAVAQEVREILAEMGFRSLNEIIGKRNLLEIRTYEEFPGSKRIKLKEFLIENYTKDKPLKCLIDRNDNPRRSELAKRLEEEIKPFIEKGEKVFREYEIKNIDRSIPTRLNYYIAVKYKDQGLPEDTINLTFIGTAGQSFGAFNHKGMSLTLIGEANDYVGKGMNGGRIILKPADIEDTQNHVIMGNTCLYGATGGELFAAGKAGERFAIRNSGAIAVVEGAGLHCCEYMTGGIVVVLGNVGFNFGAGMTGGYAYVLNLDGNIEKKVNYSYVTLRQLLTEDEYIELKNLIKKHYKYTESPWAKHILENYDKFVEMFFKIIPLEQYQKHIPEVKEPGEEG
ncbi:glutamate synthase large subunit [Thermodesulfobacterium hydrogeniphilum]|uniref:glutamate synthase large subunit n=1 Tax=Thermodesulfobacterium hydrogeniphilum TaxID=161156 RepID=UPI00056F2E95|nr:glutamate synthase large subunit [Thermodesulfobacterium hydrogeniphilum]